MRDHSNHIELSRLDAVEALLKSLPVNFGSEMHYEQVAVDNAFGRVLARDVIAQRAYVLDGFDRGSLE